MAPCVSQTPRIIKIVFAKKSASQLDCLVGLLQTIGTKECIFQRARQYFCLPGLCTTRRLRAMITLSPSTQTATSIITSWLMTMLGVLITKCEISSFLCLFINEIVKLTTLHIIMATELAGACAQASISQSATNGVLFPSSFGPSRLRKLSIRRRVKPYHWTRRTTLAVSCIAPTPTKSCSNQGVKHTLPPSFARWSNPPRIWRHSSRHYFVTTS